MCLSDPVSFDASGVLPLGIYTLEAGVDLLAIASCADIGGGFTCFEQLRTGSYDASLVLAPLDVPAVGTPALAVCAALLLGLGGLATQRIRRRAIRP